MSNPYDPNANPHSAQSPQPYGQPYQAQSPQPYQAQNPQSYGQPYQAVAPEHPQGTTVLVLGIVGLFFTICAPIAWFMGSKALKEIKASGINYSNEQQIVIGRILGMVITILALVALVFMIIFFIIIAVTAATQAGS